MQNKLRRTLDPSVRGGLKKAVLMSRLVENGGFEKLALVRPLVQLPEEKKILSDDPLAELLGEFSDYELEEEERAPLIVTPPMVMATQRDEQILATLQGQLGSLRDSVSRLRFYLSDVDDSLRR